MPLINVQFSSENELEISSYFGAPPDALLPNLGVIDSSDARWQAFYDTVPIISRYGLPDPA